MLKKNSMRFLVIFISLFALILLSACSASNEVYDGTAKDDVYVENNGADTNIGTESGLTEHNPNGKIIRNVVLRGETKDFDTALETLKNRIAENGGYVEKSDVTGGESIGSNRKSSRNAVYTIRIPAEKLDNFLEKTEDMLNIISSSESTTDVTLEYYDIEARMKTLEAKKAALEKMLEQAETLSDIRTLQDDLYQVIGEIESYRSRLNVIDSKVNYSTVELTVTEVIEYTEVQVEEPTFGERISTTFIKTWRGFWEFCQDLAVFFVGAMPVLLVFALIGVGVFLIVHLVKRRNRKRLERWKAQQNDKK